MIKLLRSHVAKFLASLVLVPSFLLSGPVGAMGGAEARFQAAGAQIPRALAQYQNFGVLGIESFLRRLSSVHLRIASEEEIARLNGNGRKSAHWEQTASGLTIAFSPDKFHFSGVEPILALHEYLGILGYADNDYIPSLGMWFLTRKEARLLSNEERAQIVAIIAQHLATRSAGGVIGVGGGGQRLTLLYRGAMMLKAALYLNHPGQNRQAVMRALIELWLTPDDVTYEQGASPSVDFGVPADGR